MAEIHTVSDAFQKQRRDMMPCVDLMGGTDAMRRAGVRYVSIGAQSKEEYDDRLKRTVLFNVYRRTLNFLRGQVFQKPISIGSDKDTLGDAEKAQFQAWAEDVDLRGHNLTTWSGGIFRQGLQDGVAFAIVDFSAVETRVGSNGVTEYLDSDDVWRAKTAAADAENGWRPYLVRVNADQVLDAWGTWENGVPSIEHFRYVENVQIQDGEWTQKSIQQIRVFRRAGTSVEWETWRNSGDKDTEFRPYQSGTLSIPVIPVAMFMPGDERTEFTAEPALIDLANLNVRHWQVASGHAEMMEYVQRPVWFASGFEMKDDTGQTVVFGAGRLLNSPDPSSALQSVGVDSGSYASSRQELQSIEDAMAMYGLQLLQPKTGSVTATESLRDTEENNSTLLNWALDYQDFLENILKLVGTWWGLEDGPSVSVNTDFSRSVDLAMLLDMQRAGILSGDAVLMAARNSGLLPDDFDVEAEAEKLARGVMVNGSAGGVKSLANMLNGNGQV